MSETNTDNNEPTDNKTLIRELAAEAETVLKETGRLQKINEDIYADNAIQHAFKRDAKAMWDEEQTFQYIDPDDVVDRVMHYMRLAQNNTLIKDHIKANKCPNCGLGIAAAVMRERDDPNGEQVDVLVCSRCDERYR